MNFRKIAAAVVSAAIALGSLAMPVFAADDVSVVVHGTDAYAEISDGLTAAAPPAMLNNGSIIELKADTLPADGLSVIYQFKVPEDGTYQAKVTASDNKLSRYAVSVDGGDLLDVWDNASIAKPHPDGGVYTQLLKVYELNEAYELTAGTHTVAVHLTGAMSNGKVDAYFEAFELVKEGEEDEGGPVEDIYVYGSSNYSDVSEKDSAKFRVLTENTEFSNGKTARYTGNWPPADGSGTYYITYPFNVKRDGSYTLTINAGKCDVGHLSKYAFQFDDGKVIPMNASIITSTADHPQANEANKGFKEMKVYTTNQILELEKGKHTVKFIITDKRDAGNAFQVLEYFRLQYIDEEAMVAEVEDLIDAIGTVTLESKPAIDAARAAYDALMEYLKPNVANYEVLTQAERAYNKLLHAGSSSVTIYGSDVYTAITPPLACNADTGTFPNGKVAAIRTGLTALPEGGLSVTYTFDVYNEGAYTLYLSSPKISNPYMSPCAISVDGGKAANINNAAVVREDVHPDGGKYAEYLGRYKTNLKFNFEEGTHTVTFHVTGTRQNGDFWCYLEYIRFVLDEEISSVQFKEQQGYVEIGETYAAPLAATGAISGDDVDLSEAEVRYTSSNPAVASIDAAGIVTPLSFGETTIQAEVSYKSFTGSAAMKVAVTADGVCCVPQGYFAGAQKLTALSQLKGDLSAKTAIINNSEKEKTVTLVLALYKDGGLTQYQAASYTIDPGAALEDAEVVLEGAAYEAGMSARLFLWGDASIPSPVGTCAELK